MLLCMPLGKFPVLTVSQICNLICLPSIVIIRAPNSTPEGKKTVDTIEYAMF